MNSSVIHYSFTASFLRSGYADNTLLRGISIGKTAILSDDNTPQPNLECEQVNVES
jgi:hypothetical protein